MDPSNLDKDMLYGYPGDDYTDIIGLDDYWDVGRAKVYDKTISRASQDSLFLASLHSLVKIAAQKNKIPALTETGDETLTETNWYTDRILKPLKNDSIARKIAYFLVWRNISLKQFYVPYPGHPSCQDFINFKNDGLILFEDKLPKMYVNE
jgi:mannan endo-1,4-beta-mannosidase